jgi:hypothetical protein
MPIPGECWLLIRQELDGSDIKFSLSNAPATMDEQTLAEWHHHSAMVMLAVLYLLTTRATLTEFASKLTLKDALEIVKVLVPRRQPTYKEAIDMLREKHENRERSRLI